MELAVPRGVTSPYSAENTVHLYEAFWSLLLPKTLGYYASAILRSYVSQSLLYLIPDTCLMYVYPTIISSNETIDNSKLYTLSNHSTDSSLTSLEIVKLLTNLPASFDHFDQALTHVYQLMFSQSIVRVDDVEYINTWIRDLKNIGYQFPRLPIKSKLWTKDVQLCIMFNWGTTDYVLRILLAYYLRFFDSIVLLYDGEWPNWTPENFPEGVRSIQVDTYHGWFQQRALFECLKIGQKSNLSTLYIPDDMFMNISMLSRYSLSKVWYRKGTYVDFRNEGEVFFEYWWWWTGTGSDFYGKLREVIASLPEKWMKQWKEFGYPQKVCAHSVADTIYVPLAFSNDMLELLQHIMSVQPELFSEIAYPLLIDITVPESHREPYSDGNLWLNERYDLEKIMEFSSTRDYIHSLKLRETFGRDLWCRFMNQMLKRLI